MVDGFAKSRSAALCHSERSEESEQIKAFQILHGVYPERSEWAQGDKWRRVQDDQLGVFSDPSWLNILRRKGAQHEICRSNGGYRALRD